MAGVVEDLHLGAALPHLAALIDHMKEDAAVAAFCELQLRTQLEVAVLVRGEDVAAGAGSGERSIDGGPTGRRLVGLECAPSLERAAVEERLPGVLHRCATYAISRERHA